MKKRFLAGLMAAAVAAASLTTTASADLTADSYTTNGGGITSTQMQGTVSVGTIVLNLPTTINYVLNPYKLEYEVTAATADPVAAAVTSTDQMVMKDLLVTNRGQVPVKVTAALEITATTDMVVMTANNLSSRFTSGQKLAKMALLKGTATNEASTSSDGIAFTVTTASTVTYPTGIDAASISSWSSANPSTDFAPANVVSAAMATTAWDDSYYSVSFDLAKATVTPGAEASDPSSYSSPAGALKVIADVNTDATWAGTEIFTANIVWNIERNVG